MKIFIHNSFLSLNAYSFIWIMYFFLLLMILVFAFVLIFSFHKRTSEDKRKLWQEKIADIISHAVFFENGSESIFKIQPVEELLLKNASFRQFFIDGIIYAKKNLSGAPTGNLITLYELMKFDADALQKIKNKKWHIKAKGIQELAVMAQVKYVKEIFRLTNDSHELVRNEAQCALINFYGFTGFRFLNVMIYPVSQWQQIQLLYFVHDLHSADPDQIMKWLKSKNNSVVSIAIRLASLCDCKEVYKEVIHCLKNCESQIQLNALEYLKKINSDDTADEIIRCYASSEKIIQLEILSVLKETGNEKHINFLLVQLRHSDHTIKLAAAKTLSCLHPSGLAFLHSDLLADEFPWNAIFSQIENERAA